MERMEQQHGFGIQWITGDIRTLCEQTLNRVMRLALASAQGNEKQCVVLLGDWNYFRKVGPQADLGRARY